MKGDEPNRVVDKASLYDAVPLFLYDSMPYEILGSKKLRTSMKSPGDGNGRRMMVYP